MGLARVGNREITSQALRALLVIPRPWQGADPNLPRPSGRTDRFPVFSHSQDRKRFFGP
jgi:hypothetical protein